MIRISNSDLVWYCYKPNQWKAVDRMHGLRIDCKGIKPSPSQQKPKSLFDIELVSGESIDFESLESQCMHEQIRMKKEESHSN